MAKLTIPAIFKKFRIKYRFIVRHEDSLEVRTSFRLSTFNLVMMVSVFILLVFSTVFLIIAYTPLKEYIPGYADFETRKIITQLILKTDSLESELLQKENYFSNIRNILTDSIAIEQKEKAPPADSFRISTHLSMFKKVPADSILRREFEEGDQANVYFEEGKTMESGLKNLLFFPPVNGIITEKFKPGNGHYGVDLVSTPKVGVKATLDGLVIYSDWNINTGYVIILQHKNNLLTVYKHNSVLLKKTGNFVRAGDVIAIIGESGVLSHGPHLHFELWYDGTPLDPEKYVIF